MGALMIDLAAMVVLKGMRSWSWTRLAALSKVEKRVRQACGKVPEPCRRMLHIRSAAELHGNCTGADHADDALDALKRECTVRLSTDGWLANSGAWADTAEGYFFG